MKTADITDEAVCLAYAEGRLLGFFADAILGERYPDFPDKVLYRAMERAHRRGLVDYGVSLRAGWLTPAGLSLVHLA